MGIETLNEAIIEIVKLQEEVKNLKESYNKMENSLRDKITRLEKSNEKAIEENRKNFNKLIFTLLGVGGSFFVAAMFFIFEVLGK